MLSEGRRHTDNYRLGFDEPAEICARRKSFRLSLLPNCLSSDVPDVALALINQIDFLLVDIETQNLDPDRAN